VIIIANYLPLAREGFPDASSQDIYTSQTPVNYEKGDPRISKQNVNVRADRANKEDRICLWMKGEHRKRAKMKGKRRARGTEDG
jgi:hypothetical protein